MAPRAMQLTLTPSLANSKAQNLVKFYTAALSPRYIDKLEPRLQAPTVNIFIIFPLALRIRDKHSIVTFTKALTSKLKALS